MYLRHIARLQVVPFFTVARVLDRLGLGRLRNLEPNPPVQRYERETPGDLIHIDVKNLAVSAGLGTASVATASRAAPRLLAKTGFTSRSTTPRVFLTWRCWRMTSRPPRSAF
jgi:hypothetical protein